MRVEDGDSGEAETGGDQFEQPLTDTGDANSQWRFPGDGSHGGGVAGTLHFAERFEVRVGIHHEPEATHVSPHGNSDVHHAPAVRANPRMLGVGFARDAVFAEKIKGDGLQFVQVSGCGEAKGVEREDGVARDLPGKVQHHAAATTQPPHRPTAGVQFFGAWPDVCPASLTADGDARRMIAEQ